MEVSSDKYSPNTEKVTQKVNGVAQTTLEQLYPLSLAEYGTLQQFCQKFYCDGAKKKTDSEGNSVIIGYIDPTLSGNAKHLMHAEARKGKGRITIKTGNDVKTYVVLNDGGLNTKPYAEFSGNILAAYTNFIKILCNLKSAYYLPTTKFTVSLYTVANKVETFVYSFDLPVSNGSDARFLPAQQTLTGFVAKYTQELGGVQAGQTLRMKISATNDEGTFTHPTTKEATLQAAMSFIKVYRFTAQNFDNTQDPTTGTPYAMLLSEDMYAEADPLQVGTGGIIYQVLQTTGEPINVQASDRLKGVAIPSGNVEDAYEATLSELEDGYYYGVPFNDFEGSDGLMYIQILNNKAKLNRYRNQYNPVVPTAYHITISFVQVAIIGTSDIRVTAYATVTGVLPSGGVDVYSSIAELVHPRTGVPTNPKGTFHAMVTSLNHATALQDAEFYCQDGDTLQSYNTYGSPASTESQPVTEDIIRVTDNQQNNQ